MTPFNTALNVAGKASTPQAIISKPQTAAKLKPIMPPKPKQSSTPSAQVVAYGKAMDRATKNTKLYK